MEEEGSGPPLLPGVILFHTGAGPHGAFLHWRADSPAGSDRTFGKGGCVILIADILGDGVGWAWRDKNWYKAARSSLLARDESGGRKALEARVRAAVDA